MAQAAPAGEHSRSTMKTLGWRPVALAFSTVSLPCATWRKKGLACWSAGETPYKRGARKSILRSLALCGTFGEEHA